MKFFATCKFGLESVLAYELKSLGLEQVSARNACVYFEGGFDAMCRANLWCRTADRVFMTIGSFAARTFDELFEGVKSLPWEQYIQRGAKFPVKGKSALSALKSVPDCQAIVKKAVADRLMAHYKLDWLPEEGAEYVIEVGLLNDVATIALDSSGAGLSRRGYRLKNSQAPLAEVLAAAMVLISRFTGGRLIDPMCGSGTIPIEAAMIAANIAPGLKREFAAEQWRFVEPSLWKHARQQAQSAVLHTPDCEISGRDIDPEAVALSRFHAKQAGVDVGFSQADARKLGEQGFGHIVCNPPYGERLMDRDSARELYRAMGRARAGMDWRWTVLSSDPQFERFFGARADKRRKMHNSGIVCHCYQYFLPRR